MEINLYFARFRGKFKVGNELDKLSNPFFLYKTQHTLNFYGILIILIQLINYSLCTLASKIYSSSKFSHLP